MKAMLLLHQAAHRRVPRDVSPPALRRCPQGHSDWDSISVLLRALERAGQPLSTDWATGEKSPRRNWGPGGTQTSAPGPGLPLTAVPLGLGSPLPLFPRESSGRRALPASRSYRTVSPERKEATMWAGSVLVKATEVGVP